MIESRGVAGSVGALALGALLTLVVGAQVAHAAPLSLTFTEARANVGQQLNVEDHQLFGPPATAPLAAQVDPASGAITEGVLAVPRFSIAIDDPTVADVTVDFDIGAISGAFDRATGALLLSGTAGGTLTARQPSGEETRCTVSTTPAILDVSTAGTGPIAGAPFAAGLTGPGALAGEWEDMTAEPLTPDDAGPVCGVVADEIGGEGGVWLRQAGDLDPPAAPRLLRTDPASPGLTGTPRIVGVAEAGSTVRIHAGPGCAGAPAATGAAAELAAPGIAVAVDYGRSASFSATATDAAGNVSPCSTPIGYERIVVLPLPPAPPPCVVPKLVGKKLPRARRMLRNARCGLGEVSRLGRRIKRLKRLGRARRYVLVVRSTSPRRGARPADRKVDLRLGLKRKRAGAKRRRS